MEVEGEFVWADGSEFGSYTNWAPGAPGTEWWEDCVFVQTDSTWVATYYDFFRPYMCEFSLGGKYPLQFSFEQNHIV